jgi:CRP-like cAMP-binding protein
MTNAGKHSLTTVELKDYLHTVAPFNVLGDDELTMLSEAAGQMFREVGQFIMRSGDTLTQYYLLRQGSAVTYFLKPNGKRFVAQINHEGVPLAMSYALSGSRFSGIVEVIEDACVICMPSRETSQLIKLNPLFARSILTNVVNDNLRLYDIIGNFLLDGRARLCRFLFQRALEAGIRHGSSIQFELGIPKSMLAAQLDMSPETLSRMFAQLRSERVIDLEEAAVTVRSVRSLVSISEGLEV